MTPRQLAALFPIPSPSHILPLGGGANNRVYKLEFLKHAPLLFKQYFQHPKDLRPRLQSEFSFLAFAWNEGIRNIPEPLFSSPTANAALYSYIPGHSLLSTPVSETILAKGVEQLVSFFQAINRNKAKALNLERASESCLTPIDYLDITAKRIARLQQTPENAPQTKELHHFLRSELLPRWQRIEERCKAALHRSLYTPLSTEALCISPSDFGFHNALIDTSGQFFFIDFEYAGWDDPCKTICDLFCQPKIPIPKHYFSQLSKQIAQSAANSDLCLERLNWFFPVMQIKWCCIMLNVFTDVGKNRRDFSDTQELREAKLCQARQFLSDKDTTPPRF